MIFWYMYRVFIHMHSVKSDYFNVTITLSNFIYLYIQLYNSVQKSCSRRKIEGRYPLAFTCTQLDSLQVYLSKKVSWFTWPINFWHDLLMMMILTNCFCTENTIERKQTYKGLRTIALDSTVRVMVYCTVKRFPILAAILLHLTYIPKYLMYYLIVIV